jgi:hypothetical protein
VNSKNRTAIPIAKFKPVWNGAWELLRAESIRFVASRTPDSPICLTITLLTVRESGGAAISA